MEYVERLNNWKKEYKELSLKIREEKNKRKQFIWKGRKPKVKVGSNPNYDGYAQIRVEHLKEKARMMMVGRNELKDEAKEFAKKEQITV